MQGRDEVTKAIQTTRIGRAGVLRKEQAARARQAIGHGRGRPVRVS